MISRIMPYRASRIIQVRDPAAAKQELTLFQGFDFREYVAITRATPTKGATYPNFRPDQSLIKPGEGYWITGIDKRRRVVLLAAARLYDLPTSNFAEHLESLKAFYADPSVQAHKQDCCTCLAPTAKTMTGRIAYHGDYWLHEEFRGRGLSRVVARITHGLSFALWEPDFLCALVADWSLNKGLVAQYGYGHFEPGGSLLHLVNENIRDNDWLVWRTREELRSQFGVPGAAATSISL
ncbi:hypothetical protein ML401_37580 (plasmid) [Bradyrhizobium sp. 62B]|uniref:hypothetical protein n=1 Tax=Bradyrhizobium sp. 62B TaxID=2898442 RepID=UPI0025581A93|nr:hypothetical protein ML401_37580 [Bradyrhizobium sp. 62B]